VPILILIIFVPYNLFRLFLVHKISASKYIYENGKRNGKRKRRKDFQLAGPGGGDFGPARRERARSRAGKRPLGPPAGETAGNDAVAWAHMPGRGRGANGV
jgi:hypothetical protein